MKKRTKGIMAGLLGILSVCGGIAAKQLISSRGPAIASRLKSLKKKVIPTWKKVIGMFSKICRYRIHWRKKW